MKEVIVVTKDDIDNSIVADRTISFSWENVEFEIDLCAKHADEFADVMTPWVMAARKIKRKQRRKTNGNNIPSDSRPVVTSPKPAPENSAAQRKQIREWANANGHKVSPRGVIPAVVIDAFHAANAKEHRSKNARKIDRSAEGVPPPGGDAA